MIRRETDIEVTVVFALAGGATELAVSLPAGSTLAEALERSSLAARHPNLDLSAARVGIFGKLARRDTVLVGGDRIEVYRALLVDPKTRRVRKAAQRSKLGPK